MMEAIRASETSVNIDQTTPRKTHSYSPDHVRYAVRMLTTVIFYFPQFLHANAGNVSYYEVSRERLLSNPHPLSICDRLSISFDVLGR